MDKDLLALIQHALDRVNSKIEVLIQCETLTSGEIYKREILLGVYLGLHARFDFIYALYTTTN